MRPDQLEDGTVSVSNRSTADAELANQEYTFAHGEVSLDESTTNVDVSVILPCYNENAAIVSVIRDVRSSMSSYRGTWEIIVVDDRSTDDTATLAVREGARVIRRVENCGSGAARKTGIVHARGRIIAMLDADGTYPASSLPALLSHFPAYDQVNGARSSEQGQFKLARVPAKWTIRKLAEWISGRRIPDLNTGMKAFKREIMIRYLWAIPDGFSCVTSMTLAFLCNGHAVKYVTVPYHKRVGKSKFRPLRDSLRYLTTVVRLVMYFQPLRVFLPLSIIMGLLAVLKGTYGALTSQWGLHDADIMLAVTAVLILVAGMLADLIVAQRRG